MPTAVTTAPNLARLRQFIHELSRLVEHTPDEAPLLAAGRTLLADLVRHDDWLPDAFAQPNPERYQQYLLFADPQQRFSVVSFVWGPGQRTPVHDHTVWGLVGVLRGAEVAEPFRLDPELGLVPDGPAATLKTGDVEAVSPRIGDVHRVSNALSDRLSISIHVYGGNIGAVRRTAFTADGTPKLFISGYSNDVLPNLFDLSREAA
jgi:predicted metal-dependent enzyme (double-stranded beta helix superfamily)